MLHMQTEADSKIASALVLRLKLMSGLDISEKRLPQDGRFNVKVQATPDRRAHLDHADAVRRIGRDAAAQSERRHSRAGPHRHCRQHMLERLPPIIHRPSGMVLVTGPTGSGKTTTLYAALDELNTPERKIITVEDPVEYRLPGINQVQIHEKIDLTFARVLRTALRQDPDVILVGEMRDQETVETGLRAAMTGPPGAVDPAHQRRRQHADPPARHGRAALHGGHVAAGGGGAAPGAAGLRELCRSRAARRRLNMNGCALQLGGAVDAHAVHEGPRLQPMQRHRLSGPHRACTKCWK